MTKPICLIIGMGPGISFSTAKLFGSRDFKIVMVARVMTKLEKHRKELESTGIESVGLEGDASEFDGFRKSLAKVKEDIGIPEVLIYNVSVYREASPTQLSAEDAMEDLKANVGGALIAVQAFADDMKKRRHATIFLTGGGQGLDPLHFLSSLGIGKAAMRNLSFSLNKELKPFNIKVATVTVNGMVAKGTPYDPDIIAKHFWDMYSSDIKDFPAEIIVS